MRFKLEIDFEMDAIPRHEGVQTALARCLIGKHRDGEVTYRRVSLMRVTERLGDPLRVLYDKKGTQR